MKSGPNELRSYYQNRIDTMMRMAEQATPNEILKPSQISAELLHLRAKLILEEAIETVNALGFDLVGSFGGLVQTRGINMEEVVDGVCDTVVVALGCLSALGVSDLVHMNAVLDANCSKFINGVIKDKDGKFLKPEGWRAPDHSPLLATAGWVK